MTLTAPAAFALGLGLGIGLMFGALLLVVLVEHIVPALLRKLRAWRTA